MPFAPSPCQMVAHLSAYAVILSIHCFMGMRTTGWSPLSLLPSMTSSLANTVPKAGHQFTGT